MSEFRNLKQSIEYYEGLTGISTRPDYCNDQQYLEYLQGVHAAMDAPKPQKTSKSSKKGSKK